MSCGRCEAEAKAHGPDGTCPSDMDEPKCGTHGIRFMFDGEDHDGKPCVQCVACLLLQIHELQEIVKLCVDQGGLNFHVEGGRCPEDDTCDCPDVKRVNAAMKGFTEKRKCEAPRCARVGGHPGICNTIG